MVEPYRTSIQRNTESGFLRNDDEDSPIRRVLADIERLMAMLNSELEQNKHPISSNLINLSPQPPVTSSSRYPSSLSATITSVTMADDTHRLIEHLRARIARLEHERNVLLTSYQLLIKLLK